MKELVNEKDELYTKLNKLEVTFIIFTVYFLFYHI